MRELTHKPPSKHEEQIARDTLERYSGSKCEDFQPYVILTNFPKYVTTFAARHALPIIEGSMFNVCHSPKDKITMLDFKIGSPAAALVIDLIANLPIRSTLLLGMCGGLRKHYKVGDYLIPVAAIRGEGTSDFYFPPEVPAMANFLVQKVVTNVLDKEEEATYHIGITHTTNKRFWEFNELFADHLKMTRPQAIEMECATLFTASYNYKLPLGALLLISDLPLTRDGIKTKESSASVYQNHASNHVELGVKIIRALDEAIQHESKGIYRGYRRRFESQDKEMAHDHHHHH